jgi:hypothetical protein
LTRNGFCFAIFQNHKKITRIGTLHFLIANSKRIDKKLEKNSNLFGIAKLDQILRKH